MKKYLLLIALLPSIVFAQSADSTTNPGGNAQFRQTIRTPDKVNYYYEQEPCGAGYTGTRNFMVKYVNGAIASRQEISNTCALIPPPVFVEPTPMPGICDPQFSPSGVMNMYFNSYDYNRCMGIW